MKRAILYCLMIAFPFLLLELAFRLLPVSYHPLSREVNEGNPIASFEPNSDYLWSSGWNFSIVARKHVNNYGFTNDQDYVQRDAKRLMAVIGDSYVEAHQVANAQSISGRLSRYTEGDGRIYSFGLSGAALSQYLAYAQFIRDEFSADAMLFVIVANDFDQSLIKYQSHGRFHYFAEDADELVLKRVDYEIGDVRRLLRKSAFVRYVMLNLGFNDTVNFILRHNNRATELYVGNVPASVSEVRLSDSELAVNKFFQELPIRSGLDSNRVLFVLDGMRPQLYSDNGMSIAKGSYSDHMRNYFKRVSESLGYEVIDMNSVFIKRNRLDGSRFEFERDGHWNELGHELAAREVMSSKVFADLFLTDSSNIEYTHR